jgi:hypothetical protein
MLTTIDTRPEAATRVLGDYADLLKALRSHAPDAHVAGGAVRDTILRKPIRDVDIFMADRHLAEAAVILRTKFGFVMTGEWKQYEGFSDPAMTRVAKFERADETVPVCLIGLIPGIDGWEDNVARFDFGVCMAAWEGGKMLTTPAFDADAGTKTFTLHRADNVPQFNYSMVRYEKLSADRYAGWTIAVPMRFENLVKEREFKRHWYYDSGDGEEQMMRSHEQALKPKDR